MRTIARTTSWLAVLATSAACSSPAPSPASPEVRPPRPEAPSDEAVLIRVGRGEPGATIQLEHALGAPTGMTAASWPRLHEFPLGHVITVAREHLVPALPDRVAAIALFSMAPASGAAVFAPRVPGARVVCLTADDLARGPTPASRIFSADVVAAMLPDPPAVPLRFEAVRYRPRDVAELVDPDDDPDLAEALRAWRDDEVSPPAEEIARLLRPFWFRTATERPFAGLSASGTYWLQDDQAPPGHRPILMFWHDLLEEWGDGCATYVTMGAGCDDMTAFIQCG